MTDERTQVIPLSEAARDALYYAGNKTGFLSKATSERITGILESEIGESEEKGEFVSKRLDFVSMVRPRTMSYETADRDLLEIESQAHETALETKKKVERYSHFWTLMWVLVSLAVILIIVAIVWGFTTNQAFWPIIVGTGGSSSGLIGILFKVLGMAKKVEDKEILDHYIDQLEKVNEEDLQDCNKLGGPRQRIACRGKVMLEYYKLLNNCLKRITA